MAEKWTEEMSRLLEERAEIIAELDPLAQRLSLVNDDIRNLADKYNRGEVK